MLPGHTPGMQNVAINTTNGVYLIAGDNVPTTANWEGDERQKHIPSSIHINLIDYYRFFERMERICDHVLPGHDMCLADIPVIPPNTVSGK